MALFKTIHIKPWGHFWQPERNYNGINIGGGERAKEHDMGADQNVAERQN